jgi:hypothetical protein
MSLIHSDLSHNFTNSRCSIEDLKIGEAVLTENELMYLRISTTNWLWRDKMGQTDCTSRFKQNRTGLLYDRVPPGTTITLTTV